MSVERLVSGTVATVFTIAMQLPQIYHTLKTKRSKDLSMGFLILSILNHISWVLYAYFDNINIPLMVCDTVSTSLTLFLICLKLKYDKNNDTAE